MITIMATVCLVIYMLVLCRNVSEVRRRYDEATNTMDRKY